jgi:hypothetical protein
LIDIKEGRKEKKEKKKRKKKGKILPVQRDRLESESVVQERPR